MAHRRLLAISYYFPPTASIGSVRISGLARFLPEHGWEVVVVTPRRDDRIAAHGSVIETDDSDLAVPVKRALGMRPDAALKDAIAKRRAPLQRRGLRTGTIELIKSLVAIPDVNRGWIRIAERAALVGLADQHFDAILSTSPPPSAHVAAGRVAAKSRLPWVADLRDLWSQDHNSTAPPWRRRIDRRLELGTLRHAAALVTVSEPLAEELGALHPAAPVRAILNGFDPSEVGLADRLTDEFTITHTGTFYQGRRDPTVLFEALADLIASGRMPRDRIRVRLFARHEPWVAELVRRHQLEGVVELLAWTTRREALRIQQESQILLLLHWGGERERGVYTGKIFEYLAAHRPILVLGGGQGVIDDLLADTDAGVHVADRAGLKRQLVAWWQEYEQYGRVSWRGLLSRVDRYSHRRMAGEFAELLNGICTSG